MDTIYSSAASLCLTTIICAVLKVIFPGEKTLKVLSLVLSLFVLLSLTAPFIDIVKSIGAESSDVVLMKTQDRISESIEEDVIGEAGNYLSRYVYSLLMSGDLEPLSVSVNLKGDEKSGIYVDKLLIYFDSKYKGRGEEISYLVESTLGVSPVVVYENQEGIR